MRSLRSSEVGPGGSRGRESKKGEKDNLPNIADAKKRKVCTRVDCEADGRDSGRIILEKRGRLKKKIINSSITISSSDILLHMKRPFTQEKPCDAIEWIISSLRKKFPPTQLPQQTLPTCLAIKPDFVHKPTREDVEGRARTYTTSFEVDVSKIIQVSNEVPTL